MAVVELENKILDPFFYFLFAEDAESQHKRFNVLYGGAGSGKSYSVADYLTLFCSSHPGVHLLVTRKTFPALRITAYTMILESLERLHIPHLHNKSASTVIFPNGSEILFKSLDDPEKIKSLNLDLVWVEEATDITYEDFLQLNLRCRARNVDVNRLFFTFNPIDEFHWLNTKLLQKRPGECAVHHSTYEDNIYLDEAYKEELEKLKESDENHWRIYAKGLFGRLEDVIYTHWTECKPLVNPRYTAYGIDFGYTNQAALVGLVVKDGAVYAREFLYKTHLTNPELIEELKRLIPSRRGVPIYADPSEPKSIADLTAAGFNVQPAINKVWDGIKSVRARPLAISNDSVNLLREIKAYTWRKNRNGDLLEEPVPFRDHLMDAMRYAIASYWDSYGEPIPGTVFEIRERMRTKKEEFFGDTVTGSANIDW